MKTTLPKQSEISREWYVVDAAGQPLGRLAVKIANLLRGRGKPTFTPHIDTGDFVVVTNAAQVKLTGSKDVKKTYWRYTGFRGGQKSTTVAMMRTRHPERIVQKAVQGMLPDNHMSRAIVKRLKVYAGTAHPHAAQTPKPINLSN
jgi:large subunit ribosomal protein L13